MFPYYHMTIRIPLRQFDRTIFEGVIVVLTKNISSKSFYTQLLVFFILNEFTENFEWLFFVTVWRIAYLYRNLIEPFFEGVIAVFDKKFVRTTSPTF
jgi:hypothetical protein